VIAPCALGKPIWAEPSNWLDLLAQGKRWKRAFRKISFQTEPLPGIDIMVLG